MEGLKVSFAGKNERKGREPFVQIDIPQSLHPLKLEKLRDQCTGICGQFGLSANQMTAFISQMGGEQETSQILIRLHDLADDGQGGKKTAGVLAQRIAHEIHMK